MKTIGTVVRNLRKRRGLSQQQIVNLTHGKISQQWLAGLETNRIKFSDPEKIATLAAALGTTRIAIWREAGLVDADYPAGVDPDEQFIINTYRKLNPQMREIALGMLKQLAAADSVENIEQSKSENKPLENAA